MDELWKHCARHKRPYSALFHGTGENGANEDVLKLDCSDGCIPTYTGDYWTFETGESYGT